MYSINLCCNLCEFFVNFVFFEICEAFGLIYVDHLYFWTFSNLFSNGTQKLEVFKLVVQKFYWEQISTLWISFWKILWQIYIFNEILKFFQNSPIVDITKWEKNWNEVKNPKKLEFGTTQNPFLITFQLFFWKKNHIDKRIRLLLGACLGCLFCK